MKKFFTLLAVLTMATLLHAEPKKLLVVTTTTGFRHSSIPTAEKILAQMAKDSGEFTVDFVQQPEGKPHDLKKDASDEEKGAYQLTQAKWDKDLKIALQKLSPESLKNYDGVMFVSTTGDLPIPDKQGFLDWIKAGHAFIGIHAAADTFHGWSEFIEMIGGEFQAHPPGTYDVEALVQDKTFPACSPLGDSFKVNDEIYLFKNYDATKVHELLILDKHPRDKTSGHYGVSWCKDYGAGKVFYTSLGHREDIWDADPSLKDRKNSVEIAKAYQAHVLGGIEWALGLKKSAPAGQ
ncbi:MAG: ThuA domain-containing protein [Limisphaerales bacterium]